MPPSQRRLAAFVVLVTSLAGSPSRRRRRGRAPPTGRGAATAPSPQVRLLFVGDIMLDNLPGETVAEGGIPFAHFASILDGADLAVGNLECVVATVGEQVPKSFNFRAHPRVVPLLARYFDAVSLANNHTGDFGKEALVEMLDLLDKGKVRHFGAGRNLEEAHAPLILEHKGLRDRPARIRRVQAPRVRGGPRHARGRLEPLGTAAGARRYPGGPHETSGGPGDPLHALGMGRRPRAE